MRLSRRAALAGGLAIPLRAGASPPVWPGALLMATGRPGGAYDVYGPAWGRLAEQLSGVAIAYRASGGAIADILFIEEGAAQLGMTTVIAGDQARLGSAAWTAGVRFGAFRALFPMFPSMLQIVAPAGLGISAVAGLAGRVVGVGPDGGSAAAAVPAVLAAVGAAPGRCVTGDFVAQVKDMMAGRLDACAFIAAPPNEAICAAARGARLGLIGFTPDEALAVERAAPGLSAMTIPAASFPGQAVGILTVGTANFAIGSRALPAPLVYQVTLAAMRNRASLASLVPAAAMAPGPMLAMPGALTFHPGAALALKSLGLPVPPTRVEG